MSDATPTKPELRRQMRAMRKALPDQAERSERLWSHVKTIDAVAAAETVMVFTSIIGEPRTAPFIDWCRAASKTIVFPEDDPPPDPGAIDVVIVPGTAFTQQGDRLGQGGGWYDRFLPSLRDGCVTIGVCFAPQLVVWLPVEPHDVRLDIVVSDSQSMLA